MSDRRSFMKKLSRLSEPSMQLYFIFLIIFALATLAMRLYYLAAGEAVIIILLFIYSKITARRKRRELADYLESVGYHVDSATKTTLQNFPLPMVIFQMDDYEVLWTNSSFMDITGEREQFLEYKLTDVVPGFNGKWLLEGKNICPELISIGEKKYKLYGSMVRIERKPGKATFIATVYLTDVTDYAYIKQEYMDSRPVLSIIMLDNYEEFRGSLNDAANTSILAAIDEKISAWTSGSGGFLCKYDRDRYLFLFEERYMKGFVEGKFSLLDSVKEIITPSGIPATISIGIGRGADTIEEGFKFASLGLEMALSRGGDQAVIKNKKNFEFYGGQSKELEKRTKVKSRVMANALGELISDASNVFIMGHKYADLDSIGAAVGICCIARKRGKKARIVVDMTRNSSQTLIKRMQSLPEYSDVFISPQSGIVLADSQSLLVVTDTNRPDQVESEALLEACQKVAVIDHHRRAASYIDNVVLNFHEPYASSACELVTELMQYLVSQSDILRNEAEALLSGIVMDTKNFTMRTGSRTFDAAAYLRRAGADTTEVKRLLQNDFGSTVAKYRIIQSAKMYGDGIAIAVPGTAEDRVIAAQAADELLNVSGVNASFVIYPEGEVVNISARSMSDINVQVVLEKLGGGGNRSTAGAQIRDMDYEEVLEELLKAIDSYLKAPDVPKEL